MNFFRNGVAKRYGFTQKQGSLFKLKWKGGFNGYFAGDDSEFHSG